MPRKPFSVTLDISSGWGREAFQVEIDDAYATDHATACFQVLRDFELMFASKYPGDYAEFKGARGEVF